MTRTLDVQIDSACDICPEDYNPLQEDLNNDGRGDACPKNILVSPVIYLQGAYEPAIGVMHGNFVVNNILPLDEPYAGMGVTHIGGGGESTQQAVFDVIGLNAIVDWVFLELRDKSDAASIIATRSALLQCDGDVVDIDGTSPVQFSNLPVDEYYLVVKHRNHLGVMSAVPIMLSDTESVFDFTTDPNNIFGAGNSVAALGDGKLGPYRGDYDHSGQVQNTDLQMKLLPNIGKGQSFPN